MQPYWQPLILSCMKSPQQISIKVFFHVEVDFVYSFTDHKGCFGFYWAY